jgi:hypothetical protein
MKKHNCILSASIGIIFMAMLILLRPGAPLSAQDPSEQINDAAMKLMQFCNDPAKVGLDEHAAAVLADYVIGPKQSKEHSLPALNDGTGAYFEFDTKITFPRFMEYSYSPFIPPVITRPSSLRYSIWSAPRGDQLRLPASWKRIPTGGAPVVVHGMQQESDTPDLNTGVYHEYNLKRTLILLNHKGRQVMISISKQVDKSNVGKKGTILGNDKDWNYYYSGEPGTPTTGLGWVKSYIYDFYSVGIYVESGANSSMVKSGVYQWLRAGWSGINFVKSNHIIAGLRRFSRDLKTSLESPNLPAPAQMASVYQTLSSMPAEDLTAKYAALQNAIRSAAIQHGKAKSDAEQKVSFAHIPKEQMLQELMLEYLKVSLGKPTLLGKQSLFPVSYVTQEDAGKPLAAASR